MQHNAWIKCREIRELEKPKIEYEFLEKRHPW